MSEEINVTAATEEIQEEMPQVQPQEAPAAAEEQPAPAQPQEETPGVQAEDTAAQEQPADAAPEAENAPASEAPAPAAEEAQADTAAAGTPAESMEDYAAELEATYKRYHTGDIITGTVIGVSETEITLDFGYYTDGIIRLEDCSDDPSFSIKNNIQVGQELSATVVRTDDGAGHMLLSMKEAATVLAWDRLRELKESGQNVTVKISATTKAGVIAYLEGTRGFIPASRLSLSFIEEDALGSYVGKSMDVRVITAEEEGRKLVMSAREILREKAAEERSNRIASVEVGTVTEGTVETIKPYGAFINLGNGLSGLLHVSRISQNRIKDPSDVLTEGQTVTVKVIGNKDGKLSLSMKDLDNAAPEVIEEVNYELPKSEKVTTSLGDLFAKLNLK